jgi:hypothetical protein
MLDDPHALDANTAKVYVLCIDDIKQGAQDGICGTLLFCISLSIRQYLFPDVQSNEGYNSLLKRLNDRAPNLGIVLLGARANIKRMLGLGTRAARSTRSAVSVAASPLRTVAALHCVP